MKIPETYVVWDLETNGFNAPECKILEIGMFIVEKGEVIAQKRWVLDNKVAISAEITAINGMTNEIIAAEGRDPKECLTEFIQHVLSYEHNLTHNGIRFDIPFLLNTLGANGWGADALAYTKKHLENGALDTAVHQKASKLNLTKREMESFHAFGCRVMSVFARGVKFNLGLCCDELGVDRTTVTQHRALGDVFLTNEVFKKIAEKA